MAKYVVKDGHTLCHTIDGHPTMLGVLAGSVLKGGHDPKNGVISIVPGHTQIQPATEADFKAFRVALPPDFIATN